MEIGEAIGISNKSDVQFKDRCPFCHEKEAGHGGLRKSKLAEKPRSNPDALGCDALEVKCDDKYTTASHHLIPVKQSYSRVRRLLRMGNAVGYDINTPENGTPLPTCLNAEGEPKFGSLSPTRKRNLADRVMKATKKQWHVGHHSFEIKLEGPWVDESGDKEVAHNVSYDTSVIRLLLELCDQAAQSLCEKKDPDDSFKKKMNKISHKVAKHLKKFGGDDPMESRPFFVSMRAYEYAQASPPRRHGK